MRINTSPDEFADFIMLFLLDALTNKNMQIMKTNPRFKALVDKMNNLGIKSPLMMLFFGINGDLRIKYKQMRDTFDKKTSVQHGINITQDANYLKKIEKSSPSKIKKETDKIKNAIATALSMVLAGQKIDQRGLNLLTEKVMKQLEAQGDLK